MSTFYVVSIVALAAVCAVILVMWMRARGEALSARADAFAAREESLKVREDFLRADGEARSLRTAAETARRDRESMQEAFRAEFQLLAGRIFDEKSAALKTANRESLDGLLKPFRDNLTDFRKRVEDIYSEENRQHGALKSELNHLLELNHRITQETENLTLALKGSSKVQGDWGEMILERMLESSNLQKGIHYFVQENFKDDSGANLRPDIVLTLPEGKRIVIDSKVSLTAYIDSMSAPDDASRDLCLKRHITSIRQHINELHERNYQGAVADSPDFVIMFVPGEPAFISALQGDNGLWAEGYNKKVIISSPTNLFALLRIVDDLWKRDTQSRHALEIARQGGALYDKFVGFVTTLESLGSSLDLTQKRYEEALGQLSGGKGNLVTRAQKLHAMGIKATKKLPAPLLAAADPDPNPESEE